LILHVSVFLPFCASFFHSFCSSYSFIILSILLFYSQNKRRREEEEYYASQQAGYVPPPPQEKKKKWYQKFSRSKKSEKAATPAAATAVPAQSVGYDHSVGGDFSQMHDTEDDKSTSGWSARSFGTRGYA
jgi:hypothetical protein